MQRLTLVAWACLVVLPMIITAYPWADEKEEEAYGDDGAMDVFNNIDRLAAKRGGNAFCARWGDFCKPDAKMKFAQCCEGLRCMCGSFWKKGKCQCKSNATFGK
jgi:hypothetical protein